MAWFQQLGNMPTGLVTLREYAASPNHSLTLVLSDVKSVEPEPLVAALRTWHRATVK